MLLFFFAFLKACFNSLPSFSLHKCPCQKIKHPQFSWSVIVFQGAQSCSDDVRFALCHGWFCVKSTSNDPSNWLFSCRNLHHRMTPSCNHFKLWTQCSPENRSQCFRLHFCFNRHESCCERWIKHIMGCELPHQRDSCWLLMVDIYVQL